MEQGERVVSSSAGWISEHEIDDCVYESDKLILSG